MNTNLPQASVLWCAVWKALLFTSHVHCHLFVLCTDLCDASTQFHCSRGNSCINAAEECDGYINCNDTSDEAKCC